MGNSKVEPDTWKELSSEPMSASGSQREFFGLSSLFHMMENVGAQLLEEILGEITALEREVSRPLLNQVKPSESLNGTRGKYLLTRD